MPYSDEDWHKFTAVVTSRIVESRFSEVAVPGTGLLPRIYGGMVYTEINGPVVLELVHLTEVGISAFELDEIREQRDKASRAGLMSLAERGLLPTSTNIANVQATLPPYPRKCLKLILSDGTTELPALECEALPLELGKTRMGLKVSRHLYRVSGVVFVILCLGIIHFPPYRCGWRMFLSGLEWLTFARRTFASWEVR